MREPPFKKRDEYYQNLGDDLIRLIPQDAKRILDVGCGHGLIGKRLKEMQPDREVIGIELDREASSKAKDVLDRVYPGDIEKMELPFNDGYFDCILFGDVLEHFVDPWKAVKNTKRLLAKGGRAVSSVPNIGHWSIVKGLIFGNWEYHNEGILDIAHLRFFTLNGLRRLLEDEGFVIEKVTCRLSCHKLMKKINKLLNGKLTHLLAWQYLVLARKA